MGILQARKWYVSVVAHQAVITDEPVPHRECGTLNDFRDFFQLKRHETFQSIAADKDVQEALRDLYDHPDKVELYPGIFCESLPGKDMDPGPSGLDSALWSAIFSDAITLVRSDRFYTVVSEAIKVNRDLLSSLGLEHQLAHILGYERGRAP